MKKAQYYSVLYFNTSYFQMQYLPLPWVPYKMNINDFKTVINK